MTRILPPRTDLGEALEQLRQTWVRLDHLRAHYRRMLIEEHEYNECDADQLIAEIEAGEER